MSDRMVRLELLELRLVFLFSAAEKHTKGSSPSAVSLFLRRVRAVNRSTAVVVA